MTWLMADVGPRAAASLDTLFLSNVSQVQRGESRDARQGLFIN